MEAAALESVVAPYDRTDPGSPWPRFLFPLADPELPAPLPPGGLDDLGQLVEAALPDQPTQPAPEVPQ